MPLILKTANARACAQIRPRMFFFLPALIPQCNYEEDGRNRSRACCSQHLHLAGVLFYLEKCCLQKTLHARAHLIKGQDIRKVHTSGRSLTAVDIGSGALHPEQADARPGWLGQAIAGETLIVHDFRSACIITAYMSKNPSRKSREIRFATGFFFVRTPGVNKRDRCYLNFKIKREKWLLCKYGHCIMR